MNLSSAILALLTVLFSFTSVGQSFKEYEPLKASGKIPSDFRILSSEKFETDKGTLDQEEQRRIRKTKEEFLLKSNFMIDEILLSGKILFNDPVTKYINKVADQILEHDPKFRKKLRFYTLKSSTVNAFTTNNGIVLVNVGLLAQLENEAQLAYILCHEVIHFKNEHVINSYVENRKIELGAENYRSTTTFDDKVLASSAYSKELELEADREGLELFLKSGYTLDAVSGAFDVLQYSYLPFDEVPFEKSFFETENLKFPSDYFLDEVDEIEGEEDEDDSRSTHPNIATRRKEANKVLKGRENNNKEEFLVSEIEFYNARELCRFELTRYYMQTRQYGSSLYNSYLLSQQHKDNEYLEENIAKALYSIARYKEEGLISDVVTKYTKIEGESQQLHHFLRELSGEEFDIMTLVYAWKLHKKYPENKFISDIVDESMEAILYDHDMELDDFSDKSVAQLQKEWEERKNDTSDDEDDGEGDEDDGKMSKYEKIKRKKRDVSADENGELELDDFHLYAFADLKKDKDFIDRFKKVEEDEKEPNLSYREQKQKEAWERKREKRVRRNGRSLGLDRIVVIDPFYREVDQRRRESTEYIKSEAKQQNYTSKIEKNAQLNDLDAEVIDTKQLEEDAVSKYNDFAMLNDWVAERLDHENIDIIVSDRDLVQPLLKKYNTDYFAWTGVYNIREKKKLDYVTLYLCLGFYTAPVAIVYYLAKPETYTFYYFFVFDASNGDAVMIERQYIKAQDRSDLLNSYLYDSLLQVKRKRK